MIEILPINSSFSLKIVPRQTPVDDVDEKWSQLLQANPHLFNGKLLNALSLEENCLFAEYVEYKEYLIHPERVVPIGITGLTTDGESILVGKRSKDVSMAQGLYELVPAGTLDSEDILGHLLHELKEETGITSILHAELKALAVDPHFYELFAEIKVAKTDLIRSGEHDELFWVPRSFVAENQARFVPVSAALYLKSAQ